MIQCNSTIKMDFGKISELTEAAVIALEQTAEYVHTEVVQSQVMPRDTGALQNESTFVDTSKSSQGQVSLVSSTPYARRLYFHPEYHFQKDENPNAKGKWLEDWADSPNGNGKYTQEIRDKFAQLYGRIAGL